MPFRGKPIWILLMVGLVASGLLVLRASRPRMSGRILFSPDNREVCVKDLSGGPIQCLAAGKDAIWSPDGEQIAYLAEVGRDPTTNILYGLYVMDADGRNQSPLLDEVFSGAILSWSPDGKQILFDSGPALVFLDSDGNELTRAEFGEGRTRDPAWSPDGRWLALAWNPEFELGAGNFDIYLLALDCLSEVDGCGREDLIRLTTHSAMDLKPAWSPDGSQIAFESLRNDNWDIYVVNFDGSGERRVTDNPRMETHPTWSPDGRQIAFSSSRDRELDIFNYQTGIWGRLFNIYVIDADGMNERRLIQMRPKKDLFTPRWTP